MQDIRSKASEAGKEIGKHSLFHVTGAPLLDSLTERWKRWVGASVPSIGSFILGKLTGVSWWWAIAICLLTFGVVWFGWHYFRWKHLLARVDQGGKAASPLTEEQAPEHGFAFHPNLNAIGRCIEGALYGSARKTPNDVTKTVRELAASGAREIPVNHHKLCQGEHDPDEGEDKFLTVTLSDTVRQGGKLRLPLEWLSDTQPSEQTSDQAPALEIVSVCDGDNVSFR
jgi:hypothetical protein